MNLLFMDIDVRQSKLSIRQFSDIFFKKNILNLCCYIWMQKSFRNIYYLLKTMLKHSFLFIVKTSFFFSFTFPSWYSIIQPKYTNFTKVTTKYHEILNLKLHFHRITAFFHHLWGILIFRSRNAIFMYVLFPQNSRS